MKYNEPEKEFPHELTSLSWMDLNALAKYHSRVAESLHLRSERLRGISHMEATAKARADSLEASYKVVLEFLEKGYNSVESAVSAAARTLSMPEPTVMAWWKIFCARRDKAAREERDRVIIRFVQIGYKNYEIAARLGVHVNTVSRAISGYLFPHLRPCDRARLRKRRKVISSPARTALPVPQGT